MKQEGKGTKRELLHDTFLLNKFNRINECVFGEKPRSHSEAYSASPSAASLSRRHIRWMKDLGKDSIVFTKRGDESKNFSFFSFERCGTVESDSVSRL